MLRPRIIPCLLIHKGGLVKTIQFNEPKYVGDPLNTVRIFNEKEVDELMVLDIDASVDGNDPNYKLIGELAAECRMPLCYGGGVKTASQVENIIALGVEKVAISSAAITNPDLISESSKRVGNQSIVVVLDVKKVGLIKKRYELFIFNGKQNTGLNPQSFAKLVEQLGAGEIVINSIDNDGTLHGYDFELVDLLRKEVRIPITVLGGAGNYSDISSLIDQFGNIGAAAGSLFVLKGKYRAVLIQYPDRIEKDKIISLFLKKTY
jgi:cyclase